MFQGSVKDRFIRPGSWFLLGDLTEESAQNLAPTVARALNGVGLQKTINKNLYPMLVKQPTLF